MAKPKWKCTNEEDGRRGPKERLGTEKNKDQAPPKKNGTQKGRPEEENFAKKQVYPGIQGATHCPNDLSK
jgi:hypothetical protein